MNNQRPIITPPPELVTQWCDEDPGGFEMFDRLATKAARWGSDQELEACCEWVSNELSPDIVDSLRTARRPQPLTLKEQALRELGHVYADEKIDGHAYDTIKRALEELP
jgi:hypothetical protein